MKSKIYQLGDICKFIDYRGKTPPKTASGIPLITAKIVKYGAIQEPQEFIAEDFYDKWMRRGIPKKGSIVFTTEAPLGEVAQIKTNAKLAFAQRIIVLEPNQEYLDENYLFYALQDSVLKSRIDARASGTTVIGIKSAELKQVEIDVPPLSVQHKIAAVLSSLDSKIALNNKINENLEQQARTVFEDWFVSFEPFENEEFSRSPIGTEIPKSLQMRQIADIPHVLETGKRPRGGAASSGIPSVGAENVKKLGDFDFSSNKFIPVEFAEKQKTGKITGYELLLYKDGGKPGTFTPHFSMFGEGFPYKEFFINEHVFKLDFFDHGKNEFAYFYMQTDYATSWFSNNGGKAAIPGINRQDVRSLWIYDMEHPKIKQFCDWVQPVFKMIFSNCYENMKLVSLRDTLLPKLMNSEFDIEDVI